MNFGAWTAGIFPGWTAPNSQLIAERVLIIFWSWALFAITATMLVCTGMRAAMRRFPSLGLAGAIFAAFVVPAIWDLIGETVFIRSGLCSYPGSIQSLSLWGGHYYQFPLHESATLGLALTMTMLLRYFRNDRGETWVERGIEQLTVMRPAKELMRFLAVVGFVNVAIMFCRTIPVQWIDTHADPYPEDLPSYLQNNSFCGPCTGYECAGPKIAMPRRN